MLKRFVYVLKNAESPPRYYTGLTSNVAKRHAEHNAGNCMHTAKYRPWSVDVVVEFPDEHRAAAFERYWKSGSGVAFAHRHPTLGAHADFVALPLTLMDDVQLYPYTLGVGDPELVVAPAERFLGIYSGRVIADSDLGFVWKAAAIRQLVESIT